MKKQTEVENVTETLNRLDFVIEETNKILEHFNRTKGTDTHLFCLIMIERLNYASIALRNLLKDIFSTPQLEYSCGIILRSVLLDYMIVLNAVIKISNSSIEDALHSDLNLFCTAMSFKV